MTNITRSTDPRRIRVRVRTPQPMRVTPAQVWFIGGLAAFVASVALIGAAHADECAEVAPVVLAKRPAMSFAPHHHRHRGPAVLRKREVGCTVESLPVAVAPLSVPAAEESTVPVVAEVIPPVVETPSGAIAAAAAGTPGAAVPLGVLVAGVAICLVVGPCDGHSTTGEHSISTAGTTGTTGK